CGTAAREEDVLGRGVVRGAYRGCEIPRTIPTHARGVSRTYRTGRRAQPDRVVADERSERARTVLRLREQVERESSGIGIARCDRDELARTLERVDADIR